MENEMKKEKKFHCIKCGYEWDPIVESHIPKACPRCKRYDWQEKLQKENAE